MHAWSGNGSNNLQITPLLEYFVVSNHTKCSDVCRYTTSMYKAFVQVQHQLDFSLILTQCTDLITYWVVKISSEMPCIRGGKNSSNIITPPITVLNIISDMYGGIPELLFSEKHQLRTFGMNTYQHMVWRRSLHHNNSQSTPSFKVAHGQGLPSLLLCVHPLTSTMQLASYYMTR